MTKVKDATEPDKERGFIQITVKDSHYQGHHSSHESRSFKGVKDKVVVSNRQAGLVDVGSKVVVRESRSSSGCVVNCTHLIIQYNKKSR